MHESYKKWLENGKPKVFCSCGCDEEIIIKSHHKYYGIAKYIRQHYNCKKNISQSYEKWINNDKPKVFCKCGCNEEIDIKERHKYRNIPEYIHGHHNRVTNCRRNPYPPIFDICRCGCNSITWGGKQFIHGHNSINTIWSEERKLKVSGKNNHSYGQLPSITSSQGRWCYYNSPLQSRIRLRSSWELKYAQYLDSKNILWYYEYKTFNLGDTTYTPDFFLIKDKKFIEVKGYMTNNAQIKINRFLEQYNENLEILYKKDLLKLGIEL